MSVKAVPETGCARMRCATRGVHRAIRLQANILQRSIKKERRVDALALRAEEIRDKLRKAAGRCK